jgi:translation initiation factor IF-3
VREIRVVDADGNQMGVMTPREALDIARERGLDLIEVAANAVPPVCRIMDYGKFKYEQGKRDRDNAKKQRQSEMKAITLRPVTDTHDLNIKIRNIIKFLSGGDKVKVTVRFKSRELSHPEFALENLRKITEAVVADGMGLLEREPLTEGKQMIMILAPSREAIRKATIERERQAAEKAARLERRGIPDADGNYPNPDEDDEDEEIDDDDTDEDDDEDDDDDEEEVQA